jgi:hypothetical protein
VAGTNPAGKDEQSGVDQHGLLPTLLAAAGTSPDPAFPPDGINLLPILTTAAPPQPRTLYWRYKGNAQRAIRNGDMKFLTDGHTSPEFVKEVQQKKCARVFKLTQR